MYRSEAGTLVQQQQHNIHTSFSIKSSLLGDIELKLKKRQAVKNLSEYYSR